MRDAKELAKRCYKNFYLKKRNCGIVVKGGTSQLRRKVVSNLRNMLDVSVLTPEFQSQGNYVFDLDDLKKYV